jgi:hypothetical protein
MGFLNFGMLGRTMSILLLLMLQDIVSLGGGPLRGDKLPKLIEMAKNSKYGLLNQNNAMIINIVNTIAAENSQRKYTDSQVNGQWKLLWTTEKETLFFAKSGLFGRKATDISQIIDLKQNKINNLIDFEGNRSFSVVGKISKGNTIEETNRIYFEFEKAEILFPPFPKLTLPPVGKGWFDNVYVNEKYRLSKDIRGDFLISQRVT